MITSVSTIRARVNVLEIAYIFAVFFVDVLALKDVEVGGVAFAGTDGWLSLDMTVINMRLSTLPLPSSQLPTFSIQVNHPFLILFNFGPKTIMEQSNH